MVTKKYSTINIEVIFACYNNIPCGTYQLYLTSVIMAWLYQWFFVLNSVNKHNPFNKSSCLQNTVPCNDNVVILIHSQLPIWTITLYIELYLAI